MFHKETFHHLLSKPFSKLSLRLCLESVSKVVGLFLVLSPVPLPYLSVASFFDYYCFRSLQIRLNPPSALSSLSKTVLDSLGSLHF